MSERKRVRRRGKGLWIALGAAILLGAGGAYVLQGRGSVDAEGSLERAANAFEQGEFNAAVIDLKNVIRSDPSDRAARYLLGRAYLEMGNPQGAYKELNRARELGEAAPTLDLELTRALLLSGKFDEAATEIAINGDTKQVEWQILRGMLDLAQQRLEDARATFEAVIETAPENMEARRGLMQVELASGNPERARAEVEALLESTKADADLLLIKGELDLHDGKFDEAVESFRAAAALSPDSPMVNMALARALFGTGKLDEASNQLDRIGPGAADDPRVSYIRALIADARGDPNSALLMLRKVLQMAPMHRDSLTLAARMHFGLGEFSRAQDYVDRLLEIEPQNPAARRMLGAIQLAAGRLDGLDVANTVAGDGASIQDPGMLALLGTTYLKHGKFEDSAASLERAAELAPDSLPIRTQLALSRLGSGNPEQAVAELQAIRAEDPSFAQADVMLVLAYLAQSDKDAALATANEMLAKHPENALAYNVLGYVQETRDDRDGARAAFQAALGKDDKFHPARINLARVAIQSGDLEGGRKHFQDVLDREPSHTFALLGMAALALQADKLDEAERLWLQAREQNVDAVAPRLLLAKHYRAKKNQAMSETLIKEAYKLAPYAVQVQAEYAEIMLQGRHFDEALSAANAVVERVPDSLPGLELLARIYNQSGDEAGLTKILERVAELAPDAIGAQVLLGRLAIRNKDHAEANRIADALIAGKDSQAPGYELRGDSLAARDELAAARDAYLRAVEAQAVAGTVLKLDQVERRLGQGGDRLDRWLDEHPDDLQVRFARASYMQGQGDSSAAIAEYEQMLATQGANPIFLNNLAWLYFEANDDRALDTARRAHELAPSQPEIMDTYGWVLLAQGKREQGLDLLQKAAIAAPENPDIAYHAISALHDTGAVAKAREQLERLLAKHSEFSTRKDAEALLARMGD